MAWRFNSKSPVSVQIENRLRVEIISGKYKAGEQFPTVRQLACDASVNPNTMQKALSTLESEGLLVTKSTSGRYVTEDRGVIKEALKALQNEYIERVIKEAKVLGITRERFLAHIDEMEGDVW